MYEDFRHEWGRLRLAQVRSPQAAAIEYFRWDTEVRELPTGGFVASAPDVVESELVIRVAEHAQQQLRTRPGYLLNVSGLGSDVARVRGSWRPLLAWLPLYVRQID